MKFKDFLKDRKSYVVIYYLNTLIVIVIMYLTLILNKREFPKENVLYAFLIATVLLSLHLIYEYYKSIRFYKYLRSIEKENKDLQGILNCMDFQKKEHIMVGTLLKHIYKIYDEETSKYKETQKQYTYFINQWVHQMKTPISVINLLIQDKDKDNYKEILDSISEEKDKIAQGLDMMLYNARLSDFSLDFTVESIEISDIVRKVINDNKKSLIKNFIFPKLIGEIEAVIETDKKWISFVITQLLINAIKYSRANNKESKTIIFHIEEKHSEIILSIEDEGIGIPKEDITRIFRPFFTGKNGRKTEESTGMGLYLSKRVCDELGHELKVVSEEGKGSKFSIIFLKGKNLFKM